MRNGPACFIPLDFDPKSVFDKVRAPVKVTLNGCMYRGTIAAMGGPPCLPLRKSRQLSYSHQREHVEAIERIDRRGSL